MTSSNFTQPIIISVPLPLPRLAGPTPTTSPDLDPDPNHHKHALEKDLVGTNKNFLVSLLSSHLASSQLPQLHNVS